MVFVLTEFQIIDARTASDNESGENSHDRYKERQLSRVARPPDARVLTRPAAAGLAKRAPENRRETATPGQCIWW